jgi:uncharacterized membrane protein
MSYRGRKMRVFKYYRLSAAVFALCLTVIACVGIALGHEAHNKNASANTAVNASAQDPSSNTGQTPPIGTASPRVAAGPVTEFPTFHPLVVHFPIMLIIMAAAFQVVSIAVFQREMGWTVIVLSLLGVIGAYLASNVFHPHTQGLTENAQRLLEEHELYAQYSLWLAGVGFILKLISVFLLKRKWWSEAMVTIVLLGAAIAVAVAGHHGAELVHKEGVGPRGDFLEMHDH